MQRTLVVFTRILLALAFALWLLPIRALAVPPLANGQGISCQSCHTSFPGMTPYGMMTMMSNFQNLDVRKQHQAFPLAVRQQIYTFLSNKDTPAQTYVNTMSILGAGFIGRNFTWYGEQPIVDSGQPGITEQLWLSWNGLFGGTNSLQVGKFHTPFPFMPAHGWTIGRYLLATQDSAQNTFEPNDSHWGVAMNGMSNEFMYNLSYLAGSQGLSSAFNYNAAKSPRTLDFNLSYGGMTKPYTFGIVGMRGTAPLVGEAQQFFGTDAFSREGIYYSYQSPRYLLQTMYYHGWDARPAPGAPGAPLNGYMMEVERDFGWRNHALFRYDVAASDVLNRQYILDVAHHVLPNLKVTAELAMSPANRPRVGFSLDWAGPFVQNSRYLWSSPLGASRISAATQATSPVATPAPRTGDANAGARLVQANGCTGCHGATFGGGIGPKLLGVEHRLTAAQIADFIKNPRPPMPNFGFSDTQISDISAYLSALDGGLTNDQPVVSYGSLKPGEPIPLTVRFPGAIPVSVVLTPVMQMGHGSMHVEAIKLQPTADPRTFIGVVVFSMGGPWTLHIVYDSHDLDVPVTVGAGA